MPVTTVSISSSVVFGIYRNCLQGLCMLRGGGADTPPHKLDIFLSGLAAGVAQVSVMSPADIVKVQLQCQTEPYLGSSLDSKPKYRGPIHCLLTIAREQGLLGLYKGAGALALRDGSSFATYFLTYNVVCGWLTPVGQKQPGEEPRWMFSSKVMWMCFKTSDEHVCAFVGGLGCPLPDWAVIMLAGGVSGMCGWSLGTPMDVIKARLQVDSVTQRRYRGFVHCVTESVRQEGPGVLFRGLGLNCLRAFPVNMAVFWAYELVLRFLRPAP
ncbi:solute carrier family 25 member 47-B isoform X3 [Brienomyrus brachyistius]|nr:solute carrier family 25 member 47-B isoform X3 [Brienomyrus brachyistius]XP_048831558.1 solute carrier family 25 member 47-B isoform X3 [Brienomyrus brachyistius]